MSVARRQESSASLTDYKDTWGAETSPLGTSFISIFLILETKGNGALPSLSKIAILLKVKESTFLRKEEWKEEKCNR